MIYIPMNFKVSSHSNVILEYIMFIVNCAIYTQYVLLIFCSADQRYIDTGLCLYTITNLVLKLH